MKQSRKHSHYEIMTNQIAGIVIGWCLVYFVFPLMGVAVTASQASMSTVMFFVASYARSYAIRRVFSRMAQIERKEIKHWGYTPNILPVGNKTPNPPKSE